MSENSYIGSFDGVEDGAIHGWCKPQDACMSRPVVEIYEREFLLGSVLADKFREDLLAHGADGHHAFSFVLPNSLRDGAIHYIRICVGPDRHSLTSLPIEILQDPRTQDGWILIKQLEIPDLPMLPGMKNRVRRGRNAYEGYQRGAGIIGGLRGLIARDPDYIEALSLAADRSILAPDKLCNLFLIIKFYLPKLEFGHVIEFGSFRGGSAFFIASLAKKFLPGTMVYSLDTFEGMPATDKSIDAHNAQDFATTSLQEIEEAKTKLGLDNVHFVRGLFSSTADDVLRTAQRIRLAHIDCDIYESVRYAYSVIKPYMVPTGYYVFDDSTEPTCIGATEVVEDIVIRRDGLLSEQVFPHHVFRASRSRGLRALPFSLIARLKSP